MRCAAFTDCYHGASGTTLRHLYLKPGRHSWQSLFSSPIFQSMRTGLRANGNFCAPNGNHLPCCGGARKCELRVGYSGHVLGYPWDPEVGTRLLV